MAEIFSKAGEILKIDLPRKKKSEKLKGYGFIEFKTKD
jgi:RNA recognition motif-containing protein